MVLYFLVDFLAYVLEIIHAVLFCLAVNEFVEVILFDGSGFVSLATNVDTMDFSWWRCVLCLGRRPP